MPPRLRVPGVWNSSTKDLLTHGSYVGAPAAAPPVRLAAIGGPCIGPCIGPCSRLLGRHLGGRGVQPANRLVGWTPCAPPPPPPTQRPSAAAAHALHAAEGLRGRRPPGPAGHRGHDRGEPADAARPAAACGALGPSDGSHALRGDMGHDAVKARRGGGGLAVGMMMMMMMMLMLMMMMMMKASPAEEAAKTMQGRTAAQRAKSLSGSEDYWSSIDTIPTHPPRPAPALREASSTGSAPLRRRRFDAVDLEQLEFKNSLTNAAG